MWFFRALIILIGVIAFLWLGTLNADQTVDFQFFNKAYVGLQLNILLLVVFIAGMVFAFLIAAVSELNLRRRMSHYRREVGRMDRELSALRNLPLEDAAPGDPDTE